MKNISHLVDEYWDWLKEKTSTREIGKWTEITTPYLDHHNDYIQIYGRLTEEGYLLTDSGDTLSDLEMSGCPIGRSPKRQKIFNEIINGFGVIEEKGELKVKADHNNFPLKKHNLMQAILAVQDMFILSSSSVESVFVEDVREWLTLNDIRYTPNVKFTGKTGFDHHFDFVIPKSRKATERILHTINNPARNSLQNLIMSWLDTVEVRRHSGHGDTSLHAVLNDGSREVPSSIIEGFSSYGIKTLKWSEREEKLSALAA